jgi:hypothetical protein
VSRELQDRALAARNMAAEVRHTVASSERPTHGPELVRLALVVEGLANMVRDLADVVDRERGARR